MRVLTNFKEPTNIWDVSSLLECHSEYMVCMVLHGITEMLTPIKSDRQYAHCIWVNEELLYDPWICNLVTLDMYLTAGFGGSRYIYRKWRDLRANDGSVNQYNSLGFYERDQWDDFCLYTFEF